MDILDFRTRDIFFFLFERLISRGKHRGDIANFRRVRNTVGLLQNDVKIPRTTKKRERKIFA